MRQAQTAADAGGQFVGVQVQAHDPHNVAAAGFANRWWLGIVETIIMKRSLLPLFIASGLLVASSACSSDDTKSSHTADSTRETTAASSGSTEGSSGSSTKPTSTDRATGDGATLVDAGSTNNQVKLPGAPTKGDQVEQTMLIRTHFAGVGPTIDVDITLRTDSTVVEVNSDGSYVTETTVVDIGMDTNAPDTSDAERMTKLIEGVTYRSTFDSTGRNIDNEIDDSSVTPEQRKAVEELFNSVQSGVSFPTEKVGEGAVWTAPVRIAVDGASDALIEYRYTLSELNGDDFVITVDHDGPVMSGGTEVDVTAGGTIKGSISDPLRVNSEMTQNVSTDQPKMKIDVSVSVSAK